MKIAAADSMREPIMAQFQKAGHGFELPGAIISARTESGHEIFMVRSPQLVEALQNGYADMALVGTDILHERQLLYADHQKIAPPLHTLATFKGYGRQFITPSVDIVVPPGSEKDHLDPGMIIVTEHPYILKDHLESQGYNTARIGDKGVPLQHDEFRIWAEANNVHIGIHPVSGKEPALLLLRFCDAATIVTESGRTNTDNGLRVIESIEPVYISLIATDEAVREHAEGAMQFAEDLRKAYYSSKQEFEASRFSAERA
ncbi:MAG: hypothetical protein Q7S45_03810 [Candidatus Curtissbacteria bacterium]|nr:hypothetical protein [Candidatus Curtissbacteria bacterium]